VLDDHDIGIPLAAVDYLSQLIDPTPSPATAS
jgi:hypothetical protein